MRIFLATARLDDIRWATEHGLVDGVATSPAMLADAAGADGDAREVLNEICRGATMPICVSVGALNGADVYRDGKELAKLADHVIVQVPMIEDSVGAMRQLRSEGVRVGAMLVFNAAQALLAAKAGATMVTVPIDQLDAHGLDGAGVVATVHDVFRADGTECDLVATGVRDSARFAACAAAGADGVIVTPEVLRALLLHPLTDRGVDQFLNELARRPKARLS
ncbi:MAG TPA: transaldolase family protein [Gemmatimonadaceae bacterium]|nr:transaldolase family protein [Gemmatimonadaceae bacterium]